MTLRPITHHYDRGSDLASTSAAATLFAGGTDIIPLARGGIIDAPDLVDIKTSTLPRAIENDNDDDAWTIGALVTLSELEHHAGLLAAAPAIGQSLAQVATRQIRNRATVGGNLLQRPRCSYYRDSSISCWMKGGDTCPAIEGRNEHLALGGEHCVAPQPSDLATVLVALDADVSLASLDDPSATRRLRVGDFLTAPEPGRRSLNTLGAGEVLTAIHVPRRSASTARTSVYLKAMDRAVWQFALVGVAAVVETDDAGAVHAIRVTASGVANTPADLSVDAGTVIGSSLDADTIRAVASDAVDGLDSLSENRYKISLVEGLVVRALERAATQLDSATPR